MGPFRREMGIEDRIRRLERTAEEVYRHEIPNLWRGVQPAATGTGAVSPSEGSGGGSATTPNTDIISARNATGAPLQAFQAVGVSFNITGALNGEPVFVAVIYPTLNGLFPTGVAQEAIPAGQVGKIRIRGITPVILNSPILSEGSRASGSNILTQHAVGDPFGWLYGIAGPQYISGQWWSLCDIQPYWFVNRVFSGTLTASLSRGGTGSDAATEYPTSVTRNGGIKVKDDRIMIATADSPLPIGRLVSFTIEPTGYNQNTVGRLVNYQRA